MNILFVHQFFPSQFKSLAPALAAKGHNVLALTLRCDSSGDTSGVKVVKYEIERESTEGIHPWVTDFESKIIRSDYSFGKALELKSSGFNPDLIIAHPGWGDSLFLKNVWPQAKLAIYCEYYYRTTNSDFDFDPEFSLPGEEEKCRVQLKNSIQLAHFDLADAAISPTSFQKATYPAWFQKKITVIHDGIDTGLLKPNPEASIALNGNLVLHKSDKVVTFVNRTLEPYRGYHSFMRAIPEILRSNPECFILIVGGNGKGYGASPSESSWMDIFFAEARNRHPDVNWSKVHFLGNLDYDIYQLLIQLSTVHVYLTYPFVASWSLLEAMSTGAAIVGSDTDPVREFIEPNKNGLLASFFDYSGIARQVSRLLNDRELRESLGKAARDCILEHYDLPTRILPQQLQWVDSLVK